MADSEKVSSLPSERERFDAWAKEVGFADAKLWTLKGVYLNDEAQAGWRAWQAASAGRQELLDCLKKIARAQPDRLDHAIDVSIIERAARIAAEAIAKHGG